MRSVDPDVEHTSGTAAPAGMIVVADTELSLNETASGVLAVIVRTWLDPASKCHPGEQDSAA